MPTAPRWRAAAELQPAMLIGDSEVCLPHCWLKNRRQARPPVKAISRSMIVSNVPSETSL